ncbi:MAG: deoxyribonuclease V [Candidatus Dadabacteria bacterium]
MNSTEKERWVNLSRGAPPSREEAEAIQRDLRKKVITQNGFKEIKTIAGVDLAQIRDEEKLVCGIIIFSYPELQEIKRVSAIVDEQFPYIPGLLAFREGPAIIEAFMKLQNKPDLIMVDGQGIAHPRGLGIASHIGVILDIPSIGVAKQRLYGKYNEPPDSDGAWTPLVASHTGNTIGAALRTKKETKPVFVSIGHKIDLRTALKITRQCTRGYRIPEPTRQADIFVARLKTVVNI